MLTVKFQHHVTHIAPFVVFYKTDHVVFLRLFNQIIVVGQQLCRWFCDENMDLALNGVEGNGIVGG